jgi:hypothetical protein
MRAMTMNARSLTDSASLCQLPVSRLAVELRGCSVAPLRYGVDRQLPIVKMIGV